jgi:hypothetical protein
MAIAVLENPVLFGMRLGAELDQLRQGAMAQAISQSLREALDLHTWRFGMIANLLAAYHRAQSPEEKGAYATFIDALVKSATYPHTKLAPVVPDVVVSVPYLWHKFSVEGLLEDATQQTQLQKQQGGSAPSDQLQPAEQQTTAPQTDTTAQPAETWKPTKEQLQAILEALALVDPLYGLVHHRLRPAAQQTPTPKQQSEGTVQPIQQQPVEQPGTQQPQGTLGGILQQQPNQQQFTTPAPPNQQQPEEYKHTEQAMQIPDWSHITQTATDQVLSIVFPWYSLVKNDPRGRQALSGFLQVDYEKMSKRQQQRP